MKVSGRRPEGNDWQMSARRISRERDTRRSTAVQRTNKKTNACREIDRPKQWRSSIVLITYYSRGCISIK